MVFLSLTKLIYGELVISVIWSYCLYGHFSLDQTEDHISDTHCTIQCVPFMKPLLKTNLNIQLIFN